MSLAGKIAIATGSSMGIGEAIAKALLKDGARARARHACCDGKSSSVNAGLSMRPKMYPALSFYFLAF